MRSCLKGGNKAGHKKTLMKMSVFFACQSVCANDRRAIGHLRSSSTFAISSSMQIDRLSISFGQTASPKLTHA